MSFVQLCRQYAPYPSPCAKNKQKTEKEKKKKQKRKKKEKREKKEKEKNPLYSVVQDVGLGQQTAETYRLRR